LITRAKIRFAREGCSTAGAPFGREIGHVKPFPHDRERSHLRWLLSIEGG